MQYVSWYSYHGMIYIKNKYIFLEYEIHNCVVQILKKISYDYIAVLVLNYDISNTIVLEIP